MEVCGMSTRVPCEEDDADQLEAYGTVTYFIQRVPNGPVKIGRTDNVRQRLDQLQTASAEQLVIRGVIKSNREKQLHKQFASKRMVGEWFRCDDELETFMSELFGPHDNIEIMAMLCRQLVIEYERMQGEIMDVWFAAHNTHTSVPYFKAFSDHMERMKGVVREMNRQEIMTDIKWPWGTLVTKSEAEAMT
jgi:hypothetical protein